MGSENILRHCEDRLGIRAGQRTKDGQFSLEEVACLASCGTAPVLQVNDEFVENVTLEMADALVDEWDRELKGLGTQSIAPDTQRVSSTRAQ